MRKHTATILYSWVQAMLWGCYAVLLSFSSNYLKAHSFNDAHISLLLGAASLLSILTQIAAAERVSRSRRLTLSAVLLLAASIMCISCTAMLFCKTIHALAVTLFAIACVLLQILPALTNSLGVSAMQRGTPIHFGLARGIGSLSFSLVSYLSGYLVARFGVTMVPALSAVICLGLALALLAFRACTRSATLEAPATKAPAAQEAPKQAFLRQNPRFALFLIGSTLLYVNHNLICNFMQQIMAVKGGGESQQGTAAAIAAFLELPAMFTFVYLLRLARCERWMKLSCFFFVAKAVTMLLAPNYYWVYAAQICQMLGFALYSISSVYYASALFQGADAVRGQSYLGSTITAGSLIALSTGGLICQHFGAQVMLGFAAGAAALGTVIILLTAQKTGKEVTV